MFKWILWVIPLCSLTTLLAQQPKLILPVGHHHAITFAKFANAKKMVVSASADGDVMVWEATSGHLLKAFAMGQTVEYCALSGDQAFVIALSNDGSHSFSYGNPDRGGRLKVWDFKTGKEVFYSKCYRVTPKFSKDLQYLAFVEDGNLEVYNVKNFQKVFEKVIQRGAIESINFSDHNYLFINYYIKAEPPGYIALGKGFVNGYADIFKVTQGIFTRVKRIENDFGKPFYSKNGRYLITGSSVSVNYKYILEIWDAETGELFQFVEAHDKMVSSVDFSEDGKRFLSSSDDGSVKLWDLASAKMIREFDNPYKEDNGEPKGLGFACISPNGQYIFSVSVNDSAYVWDVASGDLLRTVPYNWVGFSSIRDMGQVFSDNSKLLMTIENDFTIKIYDFFSGEVVSTLGRNSFIYLYTMSKDTRYLACQNLAGNVTVLSTETGGLIGYFKGVDSNQFAFDDSATHLYIKDSDSHFMAFNTSNQTIQHSLTIDSMAIQALNNRPQRDTAFLESPDGQYWYGLSDENFFYKRQISDLKINCTFMPVEDGLITILPNNYYFASKNVLKYLSFDYQGDNYSIDQFDLKYNRPDTVMEALHCPDSVLIHAYAIAYKKRVRRANATTADADYSHMPVLEVVNERELPSVTEQQTVTLRLRAVDRFRPVSEYAVWINGNPLYGQKGVALPSLNISQFDISFPLSTGFNKIQVSVTDQQGLQSLRQTLYMTYNPKIITDSPTVYYIGIGISRFADSSRNLRYSAKDVRDLDTLLRMHYGGRYQSQMLYDDQVTLKNVAGLKATLLHTRIDDIVIIAYSGHGVLSQDLDYYLSTYNMDFLKPDSAGLPYDALENMLDSIPARQKLLLIDACNSGEIDKGELWQSAQQNGSMDMQSLLANAKKKSAERQATTGLGLQNSFELMRDLFADLSNRSGAVVISAARGNQSANEGSAWQNGAFTYAIKEGLLYSQADLNHDGRITVNELKQYISDKVQSLTDGRQKPTSRRELVDIDWTVWKY